MSKNENVKFFDNVLNSRKSKMALSIYAGIVTLGACGMSENLNNKDYYQEYQSQVKIVDELTDENKKLNETVEDLQEQIEVLINNNELLTEQVENQKETIENHQQAKQEEPVAETVVEEPEVIEEQKVEEKVEVQTSAPTLAQKNAVKQAENYLRVMAFSRTGLIKQLEYEGYSNEDATYAVDNVEVDWNEQCAKKAENYLEVMSFSRDGLYSQLQYEGFTNEQIEYGLQAVGY